MVGFFLEEIMNTIKTLQSSSHTLYTTTDRHRVHNIESRPRTEAYRNEFRRDYARLIHSPAFRRLQGKTQLFPGVESDFFRNRLTHSIEVAQIAKSIAMKINSECEAFTSASEEQRIDCNLVEVAGLAHDIGHPPFGHNGEAALNDCMKRQGGFEGNAQTLRILARLEKRLERNIDRKDAVHKNGQDVRIGLNLTYRTLASILKYDERIPLESPKNEPLSKGYYGSEYELVAKIKKNVDPKNIHHSLPHGFKTIECQIMDIADDIAYSTYDLEDALKAEFISPLRLLSTLATGDGTLDRVLDKVNRNLKKEGIKKIDKRALVNSVQGVFGKMFSTGNATLLKDLIIRLEKEDQGNNLGKEAFLVESLRSVLLDDTNSPLAFTVLNMYESSRELCVDGYLRSSFTSDLVGEVVEQVEFIFNEDCPALSEVRLNDATRIKVEILKHLTYELIIMSSRLRVVEYRGYDLVRDIFQALERSSDYYRLLPQDCRSQYESFSGLGDRKRILCDFVASMTDRYALEFHARLKDAGESIFKPF